jgi:bleomycin hydrolase
MSKILIAAMLLLAASFMVPTLSAQSDKVIYIPDYKDPANEELKNIADSLSDLQDSLTEIIRDRWEEYDEQKKENRKKLSFDLSGINKPASPDDFEAAFHFPPVRQYMTGTCWCFSGTSYLESEVYRLTGKKIKLSVMHTVYYEYVEKARWYIQQRGRRWPGQGSESNAVTRIMKKYGAVPYDVYPGCFGDCRHDHSYVSNEVKAYLKQLKEHNLWDEESAITHIKLILNKYFGKPPESFEYNGTIITPKEFLNNVLTLKPEDYVSVMSTLSQDFYAQGPFEVPDNWWFDSSYYNVPLEEWYNVGVRAIDQGYTLIIGGDISEPGRDGFEEVLVVPDFDIPQDYINQDSREFRFYNHTTTDDHGIHIVGHIRLDGRDWFLAKDSGSSGHWGPHKGYYFVRDDYVRLKMLTLTVHKDMIQEILPKFTASPDEG